MSYSSNKKAYMILLRLAVFAGIFCFCYFAYPQLILDYDDWNYVSYARLPIPWPTFWNPSRVLPECLMPLIGYLGALVYHVFPKLGYIGAESLCFSAVLSGVETLYLCMFSRLIRKKYGMDLLRAGLTAAFFFLLHFLIFRTEQKNNMYLFQTANLTCVFFYLVPALLNASLVMYFMSETDIFRNFFSKQKSREGRTIGKKLFVLAAVYFCVFSNLFGCIILAVFAGCEILKGLWRNRTASFSAFLKENALAGIILLLFLTAVCLEAFGGRAGLSYEDQIPFMTGLKDAFSFSSELFPKISSAALAVIVLILAGFAVSCICVRKKTAEEEDASDRRVLDLTKNLFLQSVFSAMLIGTFIILLSAKVCSDYVLRPEIVISFFFMLFLAVSLTLAAILSRQPKMTVPAALLVLVMLILTNTPGRTFAGSYSLDCEASPETVAAISQDVVDQVIAAEKAGEKTVTVDVMFTGDYGSSNWPQVTYMGEALGKTLKKHGVIDSNMEIGIFPSDKFNEKYGLVFEEPEG